MWGQRWVETEPSLRYLMSNCLIVDMRRNLNTDPVPPKHLSSSSSYSDLPLAAEVVA